MNNSETDKSNKMIEASLRYINGRIEEELNKLHPGMNHTIFKIVMAANNNIWEQLEKRGGVIDPNPAAQAALQRAKQLRASPNLLNDIEKFYREMYK